MNKKKKKRKAALSIGSNIKDRAANIKKAVSLLEKELGTKVKKSPVFETPPMYYREQDDFYNCCVSFNTALSARQLYELIHSIEKKAGRKREGPEKGPRVIDIDIVLLGDEIVADEELTIPHMDMQNRRFVLKPLSYILRDFEHPAMQVTVGELLKECADGSQMKRIKNFWDKK